VVGIGNPPTPLGGDLEPPNPPWRGADIEKKKI